MEFHKNQFYKKEIPKLAGNKVLPNRSPFEISKQFLHKSKNNLMEDKMEDKPMTPERRFEQQKNQNHFMNQTPFQK